MSAYNLVLTGTNQVINTIFWDGSDAEDMAIFTSSYGYDLVLITDQDDYYHVTGSISESYSTFDNIPDFYTQYNGNFVGIFTGSLTGVLIGEISGSSTGSQTDIILKSQNWTPPTWAKKIKVVLVGGGGGGGYAPADEDGITPLCGGGGGAGGTITFGEFRIEDLTTGSISITIGAAGIGGGLESAPGEFSAATNGGDTLFGDYLIAPGGMAGASNIATYGLSIPGGVSKPLVNFLNTGGGPGGRGTCFPDANDPAILVNVPNHSIAPGLPIDRRYVENILQGYIYPYQFPLPLPASIAPTGGGGGLGYNPDDGGRYGDGVDTWGGSILQNVQFNRPLGVTPIEYNSSSYEYYPAFNTRVGLGGKGGNGYLLSGPTHGTDYGGGGGGAFAGGVTGSYPNGDSTGNNINVGANGGRGVAIIISET